MKAFLLGSCIALVLGIGTGVAYVLVDGISTAEYYATKGVLLPHASEAAPEDR